tara:strand:+ start:769 stop:924 length:156 start_codon:yes stop_codon:yes gene_type:complete
MNKCIVVFLGTNGEVKNESNLSSWDYKIIAHHLPNTNANIAVEIMDSDIKP